MPRRNPVRDPLSVRAYPPAAIAPASRRSGAMSPSSARLPRPSPALAAALLLAATLVTVAEARVQVRPVESTVVLDGFRPSDFADPDVQRDFCAAFTASIDLDERVSALRPAPPATSLPDPSRTPRNRETRRDPIRLAALLEWRRIHRTVRAVGSRLTRKHSRTHRAADFKPSPNKLPKNVFSVLRDSIRVPTVRVLLRRRRSIHRVHPRVDPRRVVVRLRPPDRRRAVRRSRHADTIQPDLQSRRQGERRRQRRRRQGLVEEQREGHRRAARGGRRVARRRARGGFPARGRARRLAN